MSASSNVTNIENARALRAMGVPLNTPVVDGGELPKPCADAMQAGFKAAINFRKRITAHFEYNSMSTMAALVRAFRRFMKATEPPTGDDQNSKITAAILISEFGEIRDQWSPIFAHLETGEGNLNVDLRQMWPLVPTHATKRRQERGA